MLGLLINSSNTLFSFSVNSQERFLPSFLPYKKKRWQKLIICMLETPIFEFVFLALATPCFIIAKSNIKGNLLISQ